MVIERGATLLDFEIYSLDGEPVVAAGPEALQQMENICLKGTYNIFHLKRLCKQVRMRAFSGGMS